MTLIAFHARKNDASILTDTIRYTPMAAEIDYCSKVTLVPHLDAAIATQGGTDFHQFIQAAGFHEAVDGLDELVTYLPAQLRRVWVEIESQRAKDAADGLELDTSPVFLVLVGRSVAHQRFEGWVFGSDFDFAADEHTDPFVFPAPRSCRPTRYEGFVRDIVDDESRHEDDKVAVTRWLDKPPPPAPTSEHDWVQIGKAARYDRALADDRTGIKVLIAGELHLTRLMVGEQKIKRVHRFNDTGKELGELVAGLAHPVALAAPCRCGSGTPFGQCCADPVKIATKD